MRKRKNFYLPDKQVERLELLAKRENLSEAEIVRRALDAYLAWNDPTYHLAAQAPNKERRSHPPHE